MCYWTKLIYPKAEYICISIFHPFDSWLYLNSPILNLILDLLQNFKPLYSYEKIRGLVHILTIHIKQIQARYNFCIWE